MNTADYMAEKTHAFTEHHTLCGQPMGTTNVRETAQGLERCFVCSSCGTVMVDRWPNIGVPGQTYFFEVQWGKAFGPGGAA